MVLVDLLGGSSLEIRIKPITTKILLIKNCLIFLHLKPKSLTTNQYRYNLFNVKPQLFPIKGVMKDTSEFFFLVPVRFWIEG